MANGNSMESGDLGGMTFDPGRQVDREMEARVRKPARARRGGVRTKRFGRRVKRRMR